MKVDALIDALQAMRSKHGNLLVVGGEIHDDTPPRKVLALDADDCDVATTGKPAVGFFLST